jgi:hypothetical protein
MTSGREEALRATISTQPWNTAAWDGLVSVVASSSAEKQREIYEELLGHFPNAVRLPMSLPSSAAVIVPDLQIIIFNCQNVKNQPTELHTAPSTAS